MFTKARTIEELIPHRPDRGHCETRRRGRFAPIDRHFSWAASGPGWCVVIGSVWRQAEVRCARTIKKVATLTGGGVADDATYFALW